MDSHLVAVEVGVESRTNERVHADGLAFCQERFERLDTEAVKRRGTVQEDRMLFDDFVEDVPNFGFLEFDHLLGTLDRIDNAVLHQFIVDERFEELERHLFGKTALVEAQLRTDDDNRTPRVVDALTEQVLTEAAVFTFEHIGERFEWAFVDAVNRLAAATVIEERIDGFLEHALFVLDDDIGGAQFQETAQAVVAVDDATIEIVEIGRRKAAAIEGNEGAQIGRNDGQNVQDHPFGQVGRMIEIARVTECLDDFETLGDLLALGIARRFFHFVTKFHRFFVDVDIGQKRANRLGAHLGLERARTILFDVFGIELFAQDFAFFERRRTRIRHDKAHAIEDFFEFLLRDIEDVTNARRQTLEKPNMDDGRRQFDMSKALATHFCLNDFDTALLALRAAVFHPFVFTAVAFVVFDGPENLGTEETFAFRFKRSIVDRLGLLDLAMAPFQDLFGAGQADAHRRKTRRIDGTIE